MTLHDRAFLEKIEQFLLHPKVRALSLAQRVDFLEQKGLSPEEITQCLKAVQAHNGLAQLARGPASGALNAVTTAAVAAAASGTAAGATSKLTLLTRMTRKYGVVTLILSLLGVGYLRFRQRLTEQLVVEYQAERIGRRAKRNVQVVALLSVIQDQQAQYKEAATLLQHRVTKVAKMQKDALAQQSVASAGAIEMRKRHEEVHTLKSTLLQLKREVLNAFVKPPPPAPAPPAAQVKQGDAVSNVEAPTTKVSQRPLTAHIAVQVNAPTTSKPSEIVEVQTSGAVSAPLAMPLALKSITSQTQERAATSQPDDVLISRPVNMIDLVGGQAYNDELSTSQSYRLLLTTS